MILSLQNMARSALGVDNHFLINWLMSTAPTVWEDFRELPETVNRWATYLYLVQIIQEMGMQQMMFRT